MKGKDDELIRLLKNLDSEIISNKEELVQKIG
jgi:hypothetical protein